MNEQEVVEMKEVPKPFTSQHNVLNIKPKSILRDTSNKKEGTEVEQDVSTPVSKFVIPKDLYRNLLATDPKEHFSSMNLKCDKDEEEDKEIKDYLKSMIRGKKPGTPSFGTPKKKAELAFS